MAKTPNLQDVFLTSVRRNETPGERYSGSGESFKRLYR